MQDGRKPLLSTRLARLQLWEKELRNELLRYQGAAASWIQTGSVERDFNGDLIGVTEATLQMASGIASNHPRSDFAIHVPDCIVIDVIASTNNTTTKDASSAPHQLLAVKFRTRRHATTVTTILTASENSEVDATFDLALGQGLDTLFVEFLDSGRTAVDFIRHVVWPGMDSWVMSL